MIENSLFKMIWDWLVLIVLIVVTRFFTKWSIVLAVLYFFSILNRVIMDKQLDRTYYKQNKQDS